MTKYTVHAQYSYGNDGTKWAPIQEAVNVVSDRSPKRILDEGNWTSIGLAVIDMPPGATWRIGIWEGHNVDTRKSEPVATVGPWKADVDGAGSMPLPPGAVLTELAQIREQRSKAGLQRDALIRNLMKTGTSRAEIARAAGVKLARIYQIRDGRR